MRLRHEHIPGFHLLREFSYVSTMLLALTLNGYAQDTSSADRYLALLRGTWQYHTYDQKWTLVFESDHSLLLDRDPVEYNLMPDSIAVRVNNEITKYPFTLTGNQLTLKLQDGSERSYSRDDYGESEGLARGEYFISNAGASGYAMISFNGSNRFSILPDSGKSQSGLYRVEDDLILLTFADGNVGEAQIIARSDDGAAMDVVYLGDEYEAVRIAETGGYNQPDPDPGPIPGPDPGPFPPPPYPPPAPPGPAQPPTSPTPPAQTERPSRGSAEVKSTKDDTPPRDFGTTRGTAPRR